MNSHDIDPAGAGPVDRIRYLMARLREPETGCPWDCRQSYASIAPFTIEEAYEVADTIARGDFDHLREELGDLLFQVVFYTQMAEEEGRFQFIDVLQELEQKLVRRHPHVFPAGTLESRVEPDREISETEIKSNWERIKQREKAAKNQLGESLLDTVPTGMAPLKRAYKMQARAAQKGFDWPEPRAVLDKLLEEVEELTTEVRAGSSATTTDRIADELGDVLFCCVNLARHFKLDPEWVMIEANRKFEQRFRAVEQAVMAGGESLEDVSLERMEQEWQAAKSRLRAASRQRDGE
ncbi:MAG: nucleoside triphosphate pyrophosphohydrolase [Pseudomonadota bacterium]|nr:nucleoside triphosphate pyrophosphohydrolase [Pseudomonadota bacterium]